MDNLRSVLRREGMKVKDLIEKLEKMPEEYVVEYHVGTDHSVVEEVKLDGSHKRGDWWQRKRKVVILS